MKIEIELSDLLTGLEEHRPFNEHDIENILDTMDTGWNATDIIYKWAMRQYRNNEKRPPELDEGQF